MSFSIPKHVPPAHRPSAVQETTDARKSAKSGGSEGISATDDSIAPPPPTAASLQASLAAIHGDANVRAALKVFDLDPKNPRELTQEEINQVSDAAARNQTVMSGLNEGSRILLLPQGKKPELAQKGTRDFNECARAVGIDPSTLSAATRSSIDAEFGRLMQSVSASGRRGVDLAEASVLMQQAIRHVLSLKP